MLLSNPFNSGLAFIEAVFIFFALILKQKAKYIDDKVDIRLNTRLNRET